MQRGRISLSTFPLSLRSSYIGPCIGHRTSVPLCLSLLSCSVLSLLVVTAACTLTPSPRLALPTPSQRSAIPVPGVATPTPHTRSSWYAQHARHRRQLATRSTAGSLPLAPIAATFACALHLSSCSPQSDARWCFQQATCLRCRCGRDPRHSSRAAELSQSSRQQHSLALQRRHSALVLPSSAPVHSANAAAALTCAVCDHCVRDSLAPNTELHACFDNRRHRADMSPLHAALPFPSSSRVASARS